MGAFLSLLMDLGKEMGRDMLSESTGGLYKPGDANAAGGGKSMGTKIGDFLSSDQGAVPGASGSSAPAAQPGPGAPGPGQVPAAPGAPAPAPAPTSGMPATAATGAVVDPLAELKKRQLGVLQDATAPVQGI